MDERVKNHETSINPLDGSEEVGKVFWEREGAMAGGGVLWVGLLDEREDFDTG